MRVLVRGLCSGLVLALALAVAPAVPAKNKQKENDRKRQTVPITRWLALGPAVQPLPLFGEEKQGAFDLEQMQEKELFPLRGETPAAGAGFSWFGPEPLRWEERAADRKGRLSLDPASGEHPSVVWLSVHLSMDRYQSVELELVGSSLRRAWLDGAEAAGGGGDDDPVKATLELTPGSHWLLLQAMRGPEDEEPWTVGASLSTGEKDPPPAAVARLAPDRSIELRDVLDAPRITSTALSPDGSRVAASVRRIVPGTDDAESWLELRATADGSLLQSWRGSVGASRVSWSPDGRFLSYVADSPSGEERKSLLLYDLHSHDVRVLLDGVEHLGSYLWSPSANAIVFSTTEKAEEDERGVKLLEGLMDRWATYRDKQVLHVVSVPSGARRRLTAGMLGTQAADFSPDGKRLLFTRRVERLDERPYSRTELWTLDLERATSAKLRDFDWLNEATFAPDGKRILVAAQSAEFGDKGVDLPDGGIPNSYDGQLFIWDPTSGDVTPVTRDFDPAVRQAAWSRHDGKIYLTAEDRDFVRLYRLDPEGGQVVELPTGNDVVSSLTLAEEAPVALTLGTSVWEPQSLVVVDLDRAGFRRLSHPADSWFAAVRRGGVREWDFTAANGKTIDGRYYLPPDFDAGRKYPCIVYYYGGTSPTGRGFGGRYPKEWWAANGYVVYVLQPSGATGFGQEFSAAHVNDWGKTSSEEIIEGTRRFLAAHDFVDPARVGCIGASYGGFMTMLLTTKTDLFAAAVAHAGISSISSYWGEGYWGYSYSSVATANSFPWNRRDIYVDQSPLFRADRNQVPLLLTHGAADTNVPVGESDAFYIALKLLGKEVEYLQIAGEDHWILTHDKRQVWSNSIVAWFDRWLKDQPQWWNALYPRTAPDDDDDETED